MQRILVITLLLLSLICWYAGCGKPGDRAGRDGKVTPTGTSEPESVAVETAPVATGEITSFLETTANITAESNITIFPKISGQVKSILAHESELVKKGQVLAIIDDDELNLRLKQAAVARSKALEKFKRTEELYESQMVSRENFEDAKYVYEDADVAWRLASLNLSHTRIKCPINGVVTGRMVSVGDLVQLSSAMFSIVDPASNVIHTHLPEREVRGLTIGMKALIIPEALDNKEFNASISRINPIVDPSSGTIKVTIALDEQFPELFSGMFTQVKIILEERNDVVLIPKKAMMRRNGDRFVFVMNDESLAEKRSLDTGLENADRVEVVQGLTPDERLIIVGQHNLDPDQKVFDINEQAPVQDPDNLVTQLADPEINS